MDFSFYKNKKILITGHTGFKGAWMSQLLIMAGAQLTGYALGAPTDPNLFDLCHTVEYMDSRMGDIRDLKHLMDVFKETQPEIVIHMAAQPLVRKSYDNPVYTYETNVMGTVNVLECVRLTSSVKSFLNVTTDKVYLNREWEWGYRENERLDGYDPYSNSKSCSELVTGSYLRSFFKGTDVAVSTARAGNVIGGGDFAADRIIPDCIRAVGKGEDIIVRNPFATRPYQHVLEPVTAYLMILQAQYLDQTYAGNYNIGPDETDCRTTGDLVTLFCEKWNILTGDSIRWINQYDSGPHEAKLLRLDCSKLKKTLGWRPRWNVEQAVEKIVEWSDYFFSQGNLLSCMEKQIKEFCHEKTCDKKKLIE